MQKFVHVPPHLVKASVIFDVCIFNMKWGLNMKLYCTCTCKSPTSSGEKSPSSIGKDLSFSCDGNFDFMFSKHQVSQIGRNTFINSKIWLIYDLFVYKALRAQTWV